ncbi:FecR domain-containing protein [Myxococcus sp. K15C18031901]|uniref:FecR domain-containing protein n=1 Tax=Myxococcus dinghuensis TaxID=2906761 RepID=UPI0020A7D9EC|nr:FecR domain-containing protein [Myxococcus dinghuensis]MCP3103800.1 FecR domain-containing protein [Myxococcus dinghuensis]
MAHLEAGGLWALAADELPGRVREEMEAHLARCSACSTALEQVKAQRALLQDARAATPEVHWDDVGARIRSAAAAHLERRAPRTRWTWGVALAGAVAAVLVLWWVRLQPVGSAGSPVIGAETVVVTGSVPPPDDAVEAIRAEDAAGALVTARTGEEQPLRTGMKLRSGVAVKTPSRASAMLRLPDASHVRVSADSEVELSRAEARDVHLTVRQGRLSVQASHAERKAFLVEAAGLRVSVVGTVFTVERTAHGASVAVSEGRVRVEVAGHPARLVGAGERMELHEETGALQVEQTALSEPDREAIAAMEALASTSVQTQHEEGPEGSSVAGAPAPEGTPAPWVGTTEPPVDARPQVRGTAEVAPPASVAPLHPSGLQKMEARPLAAQKPVARSNAEKASPPGSPVGTDLAHSGNVQHTPQVVAMATQPVPSSTAQAQPPVTPVPTGGTATTDPRPDLSQEFEPYPATSVTEHLPPTPPSEQVAEQPQPKKKRGPLIPMALMSKDADERFLGYVRLQLGPRTCEGFLTGLEEIAVKSPRADHREQARYLKARCFEERLQGTDAKLEYRQYLNDFPRGRYVREATSALLP